LVSEHPEWFALDSAGAVIHPSCDEDGSAVVWADLAQLDHRGTANPEGLYQYCLSVFRLSATSSVLGSTAFDAMPPTESRRNCGGG
jgi:hypothetical protein